MVWSGLGVNHKSPAKIAGDSAYFRSAGVNKIRVHLPDAANVASVAYWLGVAQQWYDAGFYAIAGCSVIGGTGSASDWTDYRNDVIAVANSIVSSNIIISEFQIGNEIELYIDGTTLTQGQLRDNIRDLAADIKQILPNILVSYTTSFYQDYAEWASEGVGDMDMLGINVYGNISTSYSSWSASYMVGAKLATIINALGTKVFISEFGLDASNDKLLRVSDNQKATWMRLLLRDIVNSGIDSAYAYMYRGYLDQDDDFALVLTNDKKTVPWGVLEANNGRLHLTQ
jgi:hypothetical protein